MFIYQCVSTLNLFKVYGGYRSVDHLFPFRTEKLSTLAPMVLPLGGRVGRRLLQRPLQQCKGLFFALNQSVRQESFLRGHSAFNAESIYLEQLN